MPQNSMIIIQIKTDAKGRILAYVLFIDFYNFLKH
jgi:hypothetical protein